MESWKEAQFGLDSRVTVGTQEMKALFFTDLGFGQEKVELHRAP